MDLAKKEIRSSQEMANAAEIKREIKKIAGKRWRRKWDKQNSEEDETDELDEIKEKKNSSEGGKSDRVRKSRYPNGKAEREGFG
jgi:hypothetical protein